MDEFLVLTPEEPNQDTVSYPDVMQFPHHQDLGSGETFGSLLYKPALDFPQLETDAPQSCGKLEAWCHHNNYRDVFHSRSMMVQESGLCLSVGSSVSQSTL